MVNDVVGSPNISVVLIREQAFSVDELKVPLLDSVLFVVRIGRSVDWVKSDLQHFVNHFWHQLFCKLIWLPQIGVGVDFDEPDSEILVDHEIVAKKFEVVFAAIGIYLMLNC